MCVQQSAEQDWEHVVALGIDMVIAVCSTEGSTRSGTRSVGDSRVLNKMRQLYREHIVALGIAECSTKCVNNIGNTS